MKLLTLDLLSYGMFTNKVLDLSAGKEGVHLIHGTNEVGKSTTLRAISALLYGIERGTTDNFLHKNELLRVGGRLQNSNGTELSCIRRKGTKNTLLTPDNTPIEESCLKAFLSGTSADIFKSLFGIDHAELIRGSAEMLQGKGVLGESLFAAAIGGASLRRILEDLDEKANYLYLPRGQVRSLNQSLSAYEDARQKSKNATLQGKDYIKHASAAQEASKDLKDIVAQISTFTKKEAHLERLQKAIPLLGQRKECLLELSELKSQGGSLDLPADFALQRLQIQQSLNTAKQTVSQCSQSIATLRGRCDALVIPTGLLDAGNTIDDFHQRLGEYRKGLTDKEKLSVQQSQLLGDAERLLKQLDAEQDLANAERLRPNPGKKVRIQNLISRHESLLADRRQAEKTIIQLTADLQTGKEVLDGMDPKRDLAVLRATVRRAQQQGDVEATLKTQQVNLKSKETRAKISLASLGLWTGALDELERLPVPPLSCIDPVEARLQELNQEIRTLNEHLSGIEDEEREAKHLLADLASTGPLPNENDLQFVRHHREEGWLIIRQLWLEGRPITERVRTYAVDEPVTLAYEKNVRQADDLADELRTEADRVVKAAHLSSQLEEYRARQEQLRLTRAAVEEQIQALNSDWNKIWEPAGISPWEPREMRGWFERQTSLLQLAEDIHEIRQEIEHLLSICSEYKESLSTALDKIGLASAQPGESLALLCERAHDSVTAIQITNQQRATQETRLKELEVKLKTSESIQARTVEDFQQWSQEWAAAVSEWSFVSTYRPDEAHAIIITLDEIFKKIDEAEGFDKRIQGIHRDAIAFQAEVTQLVERILPESLAQPADSNVTILTQRLAQAKKDEATLAALAKQIEEKDKEIFQATQVVQTQETLLKNLCQLAGSEDLSELESIERLSAQAQQVNIKLTTFEQRLFDLTGGETIEVLIEELATIPVDTLESQIHSTAETLVELETRQAALTETLTRETIELEQMDGAGTAVECLETAYGFLPQIRDEAMSYLKARLAAILLRAQIERYRRENQGPILARASEMFCMLTEGAYSALLTDFDATDQPILLGRKQTGQHARVDVMSTGARDQLYLALRLASLDHYLSNNEPLPLILDDVLVNFDDKRAQAALRILADLSSRTQIIYFTHHEHLVDLARASMPADVLCIHTLNAA